MITLASKDTCTACGACAHRCPHQCISMQENTIGEIYPIIDNDKCIQCHACEKICPVLVLPEGNIPQTVYAAWSIKEEQRLSSASGGVAYECYQYAIFHGYKCVGASMNADLTVSLKIAETADELIAFKNSKYVFSEIYDLLPRITEELRHGEKILMMGLPCQIAAVKKMFPHHDNLLLVEILCHGNTPYSYLKQHIESIEQRVGKKTATVDFRTPSYKTYTYTFTLRDNKGEEFYAARAKDGDTYQYAYHSAVSYRESCYHCSFAKEERIGDITLADYWGLGNKIPFNHEKKNVSMVQINSEKGSLFWNAIVRSGNVFSEERPIEEARAGNPRLLRTNPKSKDRLTFEKEILKYHGDFEKATKELVKQYLKRQNESRLVLHFRGLLYRINKVIRKL